MTIKPMKSVEIEGSTLSTESDPEVLIGTIAHLAKRQIELVERGDSAAENLDAKLADLKAVKQRLAQIEAGGAKVFTGSDSDLKSYVAEKDGGVFLTARQDKACGDTVFGLLDDPAPKNEWQHDLQKLIEVRNIVRSKAPASPKTDAKIARHLNTAPNVIKSAAGFDAFRKIFTDSAGVGGEWIIDLGLPEMSRDERLVGELEKQFRVKPMTANTEILPYQTTHLRPFKHVAGTVTDPPRLEASDVGTTARTISATGMSIRGQVDLDAEEDAILAVVPMLQEDGVMSLALGWEDCALNGDAVGAHQDAIASWDPQGIWGTGAFPTDHRTTFQGLRNRFLNISGASGDENANQNYAGMLGWRAKQKSPLGVGDNVIHVVSYKWFLLKVLTLTEFKTVDVAGPSAANLTGFVEAVAKARIVISEFMTDDLNATGLFDNVATTKTGAITVNRSRWWVTQRAGNSAFMDVDITRQVRDLVFRNRKGFFTMGPATEKSGYYAYNLSTT